MRSKGVDLGPPGAGAGARVGAWARGREAGKLVCATPHKALRNPIN